MSRFTLSGDAERAEKAEADLEAAKTVFADAMHRADEVDALRAEVERLRAAEATCYAAAAAYDAAKKVGAP